MALKVFERVRTSPQIAHADGTTCSCHMKPVFETTYLFCGSCGTSSGFAFNMRASLLATASAHALASQGQ